jgi:protein-S-isoprenylcysteine O-methyltransferase Ste14
MPQDVNTTYIIRSSTIGTVAILALLFISAGTLNYWQGWAFVSTFIICCLAYTIYLVKHDPALLKRRTEAGVFHEKEAAQKVIILFLYVSFAALTIMPPLDFRFGWSKMPWYISLLGDALVAVSFYIFYLVSTVNTYAASNVRVEEGQKVVSTGVYGFVRHPMYFGALFLIFGTPLALGSWWALLIVPLLILILYFRIANEEKVLLRDLQGYADYRQKVRYRLIPRIF